MRKIRRWVLAGVPVAAIAATTIWYAAGSAEPRLDPVLAARLATEVRDPVERKISADWGFGTGPARRMACSVHLIGTEPAAAATVAEVTDAYGWADCATRDGLRSGTLVPVAVHLTPVARVAYPSDSDWDHGTAGDLFPERLRDTLAGDDRSAEVTGELEAALDARIRELG